MGKEVSRKPPSAPVTQTASKESAKISGSLKKAREATAHFVINGRGKSLLGAGTSPAISDRPPQKDSRRVSQAVTSHLLLNAKKTKLR
jgi:hypothetical protein